MAGEEQIKKSSESNDNLFNQAIKKLAALQVSSWLLSRTLQRIDRFVLRVSGGRITLTSLLSGAPVVWLYSTGAKSGQKRATPLLGIFDADKPILVASSFGSKRHPDWYYNLIADPRVELSWRGVIRHYHARQLEGEERKRGWQLALERYRGFAVYAERAGEREIPVFILEAEDV